MPVQTISNAARSVGHRSRSQIYRYLDLGLLDAFVRVSPDGVRMLEVEGLPDFIKSITQKHPRNATKNSKQDSSVDSFWDDVAEHSNNFLDCSVWGPPPWSADRWSVLFAAMEHARNEVTAGRKFDSYRWELFSATD